MAAWGIGRGRPAASPAPLSNPWAPAVAPSTLKWRPWRGPRTPLGWMLILAGLALAAFAVSPRLIGNGTRTYQAVPDPDDADGEMDDWTVPPPRREFAI